ANSIIALVFTLLSGIAFANNLPGLNAATVAVMEVPLFAVLIVGFRAGLVWCCIVAGQLILLALSELTLPGSLDFPETLDATQRRILTEHCAMMISAVALFSIGLFYERGKELSLAKITELERKRREAELARVRAEAEARVRDAERFASMGRVAASVAHEVNNPLSYLSNNLSFIREEIEASENQDLVRAITETIDGAERIRGIIDELRALTRPKSEETIMPVSVEGFIRTSLAMAEGQIRAKALVDVEIPAGLRVRGNEPRLVQVFLNLLINAAQALPTGHVSDHWIRVRARVDAPMAAIEVHDNGPGIPPDVLKRVREPFFTTKPVGAGTGLGLSLAEGIVARFGGSLEINSVPGHTVVRVWLAAVEEGESAVRSGEPAVPVRAARALRVLICDDEPNVARALERTLRGHLVTVVDGGGKALELLNSDSDFDLILCDMMMPDCSGMDVHDRLQRSHPELAERIVFMSGGVFTERAEEFQDTIRNRLLHKPINVYELRELVAEISRREAS
ncbi:MAG: ATP-binding protein, partial [Myxococcota bacterium]